MSKSKTPPPGPEHSQEREWRVVLEDIRSEFRVFGEGLADVQEKVAEIPEIKEKLEKLESDVSLIKIIIPTLATKKDLEPLATKEDLKKLEKRLTAVETR